MRELTLGLLAACGSAPPRMVQGRIAPSTAEPPTEPGQLATLQVSRLARAHPSKYWLTEALAAVPLDQRTYVVPLLSERGDKLLVVVGDTNSRIAIWIPRSDAVAMWSRSKTEGDFLQRPRSERATWGVAKPIPAGTCLFSDVAGKIVGVVIDDLHYAKPIGQGWRSVAVYSPFGILTVAAYATRDEGGEQTWFTCPRPR